MVVLVKHDELFEMRAVRDFKSIITHSDLIEEIMLVAKSMRNQPPTLKEDSNKEDKADLEEEKKEPVLERMPS
jgi:hypothetical protein